MSNKRDDDDDWGEKNFYPQSPSNVAIFITTSFSGLGSDPLPMSNIDKTTVVQECRCFNDREVL